MFENIKNNLLTHGVSLSGYLSGNYDIVVPFSGGKDSQACLKIASTLQDKRVLALFCDTQYEHSLTYAHVDRICELYNVDLVKLCAGSVLEICTLRGRFPGGGARHCTDSLKIRPSKFFYKYLAQEQGTGFQVWFGMRSNESRERAERYKFVCSDDLYSPNEVMKNFPKYLDKLGVKFRLPVIDFARDEIMSLLGDEANPLYSYGFDRVGCFPCLAGGEGLQVKAFEFDDEGRKHFRIAQQISESVGYPVFTTKKFTDYSGPGCSFCSI